MYEIIIKSTKTRTKLLSKVRISVRRTMSILRINTKKIYERMVGLSKLYEFLYEKKHEIHYENSLHVRMIPNNYEIVILNQENTATIRWILGLSSIALSCTEQFIRKSSLAIAKDTLPNPRFMRQGRHGSPFPQQHRDWAHWCCGLGLDEGVESDGGSGSVGRSGSDGAMNVMERKRSRKSR